MVYCLPTAFLKSSFEITSTGQNRRTLLSSRSGTLSGDHFRVPTWTALLLLQTARSFTTESLESMTKFTTFPTSAIYFPSVLIPSFQLNDLLSWRRHRVWKKGDCFHVAKEGDTVLDLCCGSGDLTFLLSEKVGSLVKVVGLDLSKELLTIATARQKSNSKECNKNIKWIEGDALDLQFPESYFDAVTIGYGIGSMKDRRKALKEIHRILKPGSKVSVLDYNKSNNRFKTFFQDRYLDNVVVPIAKSYGVGDSFRQHVSRKELEDLALEVGFSSAKHFELVLGRMGNFVATK
ncbi:OLC1v1016381C1 [Oldenlandia corymbosa var. corymbosa]|uniref:OLC1v1016381C1 n=1 Tax=Oldenlandia corymbosa var. corymbosa TaxID=529605 RepID=A0AAV1E5C8_OLDCO|nr:OLC1v1016381C1 [Oldenlandia corymbosa var. corymbosa]